MSSLGRESGSRAAMKTRQGIIYQRVTRSKTLNDVEETSLPIPLDLVMEIFSRLPAKSIARCRCVSKPWASILRRPDFTELFFTKSSARPQILLSIVKDRELLVFSVPQVQNLNIVAADYLTKFSDGYSTAMYSPVHGLVFVNNQLRIVNGKKEDVPVVYNPSTGQSLHFPKLETTRTSVASFFGYDPIGKQYKVLSLTWPRFGPGGFRNISQKHKVLTLGAKKMSWRMVECVPHSSEGRGICINGVLYYIAKIDKPGYTIACFDVRTHEYRFVERDEGMILKCYSILVNYKGKLGVLLKDGNKIDKLTREIELWVLVDFEKHEWSKHVYVLPDSWKDVVGNDWYYFAGLTCSNEVVLSQFYVSKRLYVLYYNLERKTIKRVEVQGIDAFNKPFHFRIFLNHVEDVKRMQVF